MARRVLFTMRTGRRDKITTAYIYQNRRKKEQTGSFWNADGIRKYRELIFDMFTVKTVQSGKREFSYIKYMHHRTGGLKKKRARIWPRERKPHR